MTGALENSRILGDEHAKPGCLPPAAKAGQQGTERNAEQEKEVEVRDEFLTDGSV